MVFPQCSETEAYSCSAYQQRYVYCRNLVMCNGLPFRVLVVDDDEDDRFMIDEAFGKIGYEAAVKKFINGKMLLHYLEGLSPSLYPALIVLDNTLPELDAAYLLRILKSNPAYKDILMIVYTTVLTPNKKEQLVAAGADACLEKGNTMEELVQVATRLKAIAESNNPGK
jgi:CheY-like chemotaxis protein